MRSYPMRRAFLAIVFLSAGLSSAADFSLPGGMYSSASYGARSIGFQPAFTLEDKGGLSYFVSARPAYAVSLELSTIPNPDSSVFYGATPEAGIVFRNWFENMAIGLYTGSATSAYTHVSIKGFPDLGIAGATGTGTIESTTLGNDTRLGLAWQLNEHWILDGGLYFGLQQPQELFNAEISVSNNKMILESNETSNTMGGTLATGVQYRENSSALTANIIYPAYLYTSTDAASVTRVYNGSTLSSESDKRDNLQYGFFDAPEMRLGISENIFPFLRVFIDMGIQVPFESARKTLEFHDSKYYHFKGTESNSFTYSPALAITLKLPKSFEVSAGYSYASDIKETEMTSGENTIIERQKETSKSYFTGTSWSTGGMAVSFSLIYLDLQNDNSDIKKWDSASEDSESEMKAGLLLAEIGFHHKILE